VIAETLEEIDDDRLEMVTITGIDTDPDLRHAHVYFSALNGQEQAGEVLAEHRVRLQAAIGRQMHMKRTPQLDFRVDPSIIEGFKIESIIATMPRSAEEAAEADEPAQPVTES
jgi:ribosome-binding factor A